MVFRGWDGKEVVPCENIVVLPLPLSLGGIGRSLSPNLRGLNLTATSRTKKIVVCFFPPPFLYLHTRKKDFRFPG